MNNFNHKQNQHLFFQSCTFKGSLFSVRYFHTTQIAAVNEWRVYQNESSQKAEVYLIQKKEKLLLK